MNRLTRFVERRPVPGPVEAAGRRLLVHLRVDVDRREEHLGPDRDRRRGDRARRDAADLLMPIAAEFRSPLIARPVV